MARALGSNPVEWLEDLYDDYEEYEDQMRAAFQVFLAFDEDKNQTIDEEEFEEFLTRCGLTEGLDADTAVSTFSSAVRHDPEYPP